MNHYDEDGYDEYEDYSPQYRQPRRRRCFHLNWKVVVPVVVVLLVLVSLRFCSTGGRQRPPVEPPRTQTVKVISMSELDLRVRAVAVSARDEAVRHAEEAVRRWVDGLRQRNGEFCDWYFSYFTANSLELRSLGYAVADTMIIEAIAGEQPSAAERMEAILSESYAGRVLSPMSAQLKVESICRESVEIYLLALSHQLSGLDAEFAVADGEWQRHLEGAARLSLSIESARQLPVVTKLMVVGSGVAVAKAIKAGSGHLRGLLVKAGGERLLAGGASVGSKFARGSLWWIAIGLTAADLLDHRHTVNENRPVLERSLDAYLDELVQIILYDSQTGIVPVIDSVQNDVLSRIETQDESERK
jgi:hypothetical protein